MSMDHYIPRFILRRFAYNKDANKANHRIQIFNVNSGKVCREKVSSAFAVEDLNSVETEHKLNVDFERGTSKIIVKIEQAVKNNEKDIVLSKDEYRLLFRFLTVMWRRNTIQLDKAKEMTLDFNKLLTNILGDRLQDMLLPQYRDKDFNKLVIDKLEKNTQKIYDMAVSMTTDDDPTVQKTLRNYRLFIIKNSSDIDFILHNTYTTLNYYVREGFEVDGNDIPISMVAPISNKLCLVFLYDEKGVDIEADRYKVLIDECSDNERINVFFIDRYITPTATDYVVNDSNIQYLMDNEKIKKLLENK